MNDHFSKKFYDVQYDYLAHLYPPTKRNAANTQDYLYRHWTPKWTGIFSCVTGIKKKTQKHI